MIYDCMTMTISSIQLTSSIWGLSTSGWYTQKKLTNTKYLHSSLNDSAHSSCTIARFQVLSRTKASALGRLFQENPLCLDMEVVKQCTNVQRISISWWQVKATMFKHVSWLGSIWKHETPEKLTKTWSSFYFNGCFRFKVHSVAGRLAGQLTPQGPYYSPSENRPASNPQKIGLSIIQSQHFQW